MSSPRRAVIDIGSNSIKLLVTEVEGYHVHPICEESEQTRLGEGCFETKRLREETIQATAFFAAKFADIARNHHAANIRVIATSAARDAANQTELSRRIREKAGLEVEII